MSSYPWATAADKYRSKIAAAFEKKTDLDFGSYIRRPQRVSGEGSKAVRLASSIARLGIVLELLPSADDAGRLEQWIRELRVAVHEVLRMAGSLDADVQRFIDGDPQVTPVSQVKDQPRVEAGSVVLPAEQVVQVGGSGVTVSGTEGCTVHRLDDGAGHEVDVVVRVQLVSEPLVDDGQVSAHQTSSRSGRLSPADATSRASGPTVEERRPPGTAILIPGAGGDIRIEVQP